MPLVDENFDLFRAPVQGQPQVWEAMEPITSFNLNRESVPNYVSLLKTTMAGVPFA